MSATGAREDAPGLRALLQEALDALESMPLGAMGHAVETRRRLRAALATTPSWPSPDDEVAVGELAARWQHWQRCSYERGEMEHSCDCGLFAFRARLQALSPTPPKPKETGER